MRIMLLAVLLSTLLGCSKTELIYRNADWLIETWVDQQLELTSEQKTAWRQQLNLVLLRHREVELAQLTGFLREFERHAEHQLSEAVVECLVARADDLLRHHAKLAVDLTVPLLMGLTDRQITLLAENLEERDAQYRQKYLEGDAEQRARDRAQRVLERIERWSGALDARQRNLVALATREMPDLAGSWLDYRRERQRQLLLLLRNRAGPDALREFLDAWWVELAGRPRSLVDAVQAVRRTTVALLSRLDRTLSPEQRRELVTRISRLRADLAALAGAAPVAEPVCFERSAGAAAIPEGERRNAVTAGIRDLETPLWVTLAPSRPAWRRASGPDPRPEPVTSWASRPAAARAGPPL